MPTVEGTRPPVPAYLVQADEGTRVLIDTGFGREMVGAYTQLGYSGLTKSDTAGEFRQPSAYSVHDPFKPISDEEGGPRNGASSRTLAVPMNSPAVSSPRLWPFFVYTAHDAPRDGRRGRANWPHAALKRELVNSSPFFCGRRYAGVAAAKQHTSGAGKGPKSSQVVGRAS